MEVTQVGMIRTRDRAMAMVTEEDTPDNSGAVVKRRKLSNEKLRPLSSTFVETISVDCESHVVNSCDAAACSRSVGVLASCCSSNGSIEKLKFPDLEVSNLQESVETGTHYLDGGESIPKTEFKAAKPGALGSTEAKQSMAMSNSCCTVRLATKMPPEAELEEFFAAAQEGLNQRFINKYNYDIVNDIPLKGRFEWIQIKPEK